MKKTIATLAIALVMVPSISFAQTSAETQNALLRQLISLLMQQVQLLQEQLAELQTVEVVAEQVYEEKEAEKQAEADAIAEAEAAEAEKLAQEAEAALQEKLNAIEKNGYYIECNEDGSRCIKWTSEFCWMEPNGHGAYHGKSCGG